MRYEVIMTRDVTESAVVLLDASSEEEAKELAYQKVAWGLGLVAWTLDDIGDSPPYCTGCEPKKACPCLGPADWCSQTSEGEDTT
jgi:hypothetical protein